MTGARHPIGQLVDPGGTAGDIADTAWFGGITVAQAIGAVLIIAALIYAVRKILKALRPVRDFLDDWNGEPNRPGVHSRPGVMARLDRIEQHLTDAPTRREFTEVQQHLARHDVQIAQLMPPPGVHHTVTTVTSTDIPQEG